MRKLVALGIVTDEDGRLLLTQRYEPTAPEISGRWEFPGGTVELGELPYETVRREIAEETGVRVEVKEMLPLAFLATRRMLDSDVHIIALCFRCALIGKSTQPLSLPTKVAAVRWIELEAARNYDLQDGTKMFLKHLFEK